MSTEEPEEAIALDLSKDASSSSIWQIGGDANKTFITVCNSLVQKGMIITPWFQEVSGVILTPCPWTHGKCVIEQQNALPTIFE